MKKILLMATGSVAVEKTYKLQQMLNEKYEVKTLITPYVKKFFKDAKKLNAIDLDPSLDSFPTHIELAKWADLILVCPASANTLAKFNAGIADNGVMCTLLAARTPIIFVPAMNTYMYKAIVERGVISNINKLGHMFIGPTVGKLREGESGLGRMIEPEEIFESINNYFSGSKANVIISKGASKVYIDPLRFISNDSSGVMGSLLANEFRMNGYNVKEIEIANYSNQEVVDIINSEKWDIYLSVGAFADFEAEASKTKIKKGTITKIDLSNNVDVLSNINRKNKVVIGFKYDDSKQNAINKKENLKLDGIVWNKIGAMNNNKISGEILLKDKNFAFSNISKAELAKKIISSIKECIID